ncbi:hypothetical protein LJR164_001584 [Phenylobacterium sp. LjRoot164]|uniref:hypothetical protein n=1 Tax=unclassified Phenylobacterium TaxID=2640670 RepID=UPI003ECDE6DE
MSYDYVRRMYGVDPIVGHRVRHTEMKGPRSFGVIARESPSQGHHVMVRFDGQKHASPCHPTALDYSPGDPA